MKKKAFATVLACMVVCSLLAGCGSTSGSSAPAEETKEETEAAVKEAEEEAEAAVEEAKEETEAAVKEAEAAVEETKEETEAAVKEAKAAVEEAQVAVAGETAEAEAPAGEPEAGVAGEAAEIQVFIAASLNTSMQEVAAKYNEEHPEVTITFNADSSGKLLTQIEEGYACDVFFSAAQKQMNQLEEDGLVVEGTRADVVNNQVVVIKRKDTESEVTGLEDLGKASSIAMADGSVPVGRYTRTALMNLGILPRVEDASVYTTAEVSDALGGVEISEQGNVSQVLTAVTEGSCEVGTTYYSDTCGYEDQIDILEKVSYDLTGNVIYPVCQVVNEEATEAEKAAAADFVSFITSDTAKEIFEAFYFDTNLQ